MTQDAKKKEELDLIEKKMWTSKDVWKAISSVAVAVFVITLIYAQFLSMGKDLEFLKATQASEIKILTDRVDKQNARWNENLDKLEEAVDANADGVILLKLDAHEPSAGQKRIHR